MSLEAAEQAVREGRLDEASQALSDEVRRDPANAKLRVFLFQLRCVQGDWERALAQLKVAADLDDGALAMAQMYRETINCEQLRAKVFAGETAPLVFGEPEQWVAVLIESLLARDAAQTAELRARAFEEAPASPGTVDDTAFAWIADADQRLGPVCEAIINGRYYWLPFARVTRIEIEAPADLRDVVWTPAHFFLTNGGETPGVIPSRYPGSETGEDTQIQLARKTVWTEETPDQFVGKGQRIWTTDTDEYALMDIRRLVIGSDIRAVDASDTKTADA